MFAVTGAAVAALVLPAAPAMADGHAPSGKATVKSAADGVKRASISCNGPKGNTTNYSWGVGSWDSTTVYFNNHCNHPVKALLTFKGQGGKNTYKICQTTNGGTHGKKRYTITRHWLQSITKATKSTTGTGC
ncbi:hypothetical protein ACWC2K_21285 [Streptomyces chattanoogensis]